jgi:hypothetical protein
MSPKFISFALSKAQILAFLGLTRATKITKQTLIEQLLERIETNADEKARLLETFLYELAVEPVELEEILHCTPIERRRWVKEGKLPVLEYRTFRKSGHDLEYPVHDRREILLISQDDIQQWRAIHQDEVRVRRQAAAQLALESRKVNQQKRQQFFHSWQQTIDEWRQKGSSELAHVLVLAYWTIWASRWAKENQIKAARGTKHAELYARRRDEWYERKNQAMLLLAQTPYARLSFYRPPDPDKYHLWLCQEHYEEKYEEYYESIWEYYYQNAERVKQCPQCSVSYEKDYYALYYLEITSAVFPDLRFSFHMPYPIGRANLPKPQTLPRVEHTEQDGMFRFGRPLIDDEKIIYREQDVQTNFEHALAQAKQLSFPHPSLNGTATISRSNQPALCENATI